MDLKLSALALSVFFITLIPQFVDVKKGNRPNRWGYGLIVFSALFFIISWKILKDDEKDSEDKTISINSLTGKVDEIKNALFELGLKYDDKAKVIVTNQDNRKITHGITVENSPGATIRGNTTSSTIIYEQLKDSINPARP